MKNLIIKGGFLYGMLLLLPLSIRSENKTPSFDKKWTPATEAFVQQALPKITAPFTADLNEKTVEWVRLYTTRGSRSFERMLGKSTYYFPIFEEALQAYALPSELKYLAMVESGLFPTIESPAGAGGLWQFMPATARAYDLHIDDWVDERFDPYRSSLAAAKILNDLYEQFEDWKLVLAAYNCGPGRVRKAIRRAGTAQYENLRHLLPLQTRNYLIKYTATAFVAEHHLTLGLIPRHSETDLMETSVIKVYDWMSLEGVSKASRVPLQTLRRLNPSYKKGIIPKNDSGNLLIIPNTAALFFEQYLEERGVEPLEYLLGEPVRPEPEIQPETRYWASAHVKPLAGPRVLQFNLQGLLSWSHAWGKSVFNTLKISHFLSSGFSLF